MTTYRSAWARTRPAETTSGSAQRPARLRAGAALRFDLAVELVTLTAETSWLHGDRTARTLVRDPQLRRVLMGVKAGAWLEEQRADRKVSRHTLTGQLRLDVADETSDLPAGHRLVLDPGVPHDMEAVTESPFLLTIGGYAGGVEAARERRCRQRRGGEGVPSRPIRIGRRTTRRYEGGHDADG